MLDAFAAEYREAMRVKEARALEVDALRNSNRNLAAQV
jgi:aarF domain-containing kinase